MKKKESFNFEYYTSHKRLFESMYIDDASVQLPLESDTEDAIERDNTLSLIKRLSDVEKEQKETRIFQSKYAVVALKTSSIRVWKGSILSIDTDSFNARLVETTGSYKPRIVTIKKSVVNKLDWDDFFHVGHEFDWVFKDVWKNGGRTTSNEIRFSPTPRFLNFEVERYVNDKLKRFSYMMTDDD